LEINKNKGKFQLTSSNYHFNDNLPPNYQLRQITKTMTIYPQFFKNNEITLTKTKTKILFFFSNFEGYFFLIENFVEVISLFC
jgi:hypothetical protein